MQQVAFIMRNSMDLGTTVRIHCHSAGLLAPRVGSLFVKESARHGAVTSGG